MRHTTPPYEVGPDGLTIVCEWNGKKHVIACVTRVLPWHENIRKSADEAKATAKLLAASGELLAAAEKIELRYEGGLAVIRGLAELRDAIAKAKGATVCVSNERRHDPGDCLDEKH